ncbi:MAG TPA: MBL fold metallo-hydrolase [Pseudonocardiaceae bacterium]
MRLTVLGCSGSLPGPASPSAGYLLEADGVAVALDLGNGTLSALQRAVEPFELGAVALSHLHPDHCADTTGLLVYLRYHPRRPAGWRPLPVYGPSETRERLAGASATSAAELAEIDMSDVFEFHGYGGEQRIGPFAVTTATAAHPCEAYATRLEHDGRSLVYTGDTGPCAAVTELARGADVLLSEASWTDDPSRPADLHLSGVQAGELATAAGVGRLLLTHVLPWADRDAVLAEARSTFDGPVELVEVGGVYEV